ncbi:MAG: thioredoxin fold domain-containing protein [Pseudomonadales bacterium]|nr:thioredoxin fold domain-containing protein [Pseudomonadales bacterium]
MNKNAVVFLLSVLTFVGAQPLMAESVSGTIEQIRDRLLSSEPKLPISTVQKSEFDGLYEVELSNGQTLYTSKAGDYIVVGEMYKVTTEGMVNVNQAAIDESRRKNDVLRAAKVSSLDESQMIIFSPESPKATITVFTDIDCGYCRKLHRDVPALNELGIAVRYLAFPRAGLRSKTYQNMVSAWCALDKREAMNKLKAGIAIATKTCVNPVADHYQLGHELGVSGTPALVLENGQLIPGYLEPAKMAQAVGLN